MMSVSVIIPAYQAADSIGETVTAARRIPGVFEVIVVDDGSRDGTAEAARRAEADQVIVLPRNLGKGGALAAGVRAAGGEQLLFLDADLGRSAAGAERLLPMVAGPAVMSVAMFPERSGGAGLGMARGLAAATIHLLTGLRVAAPLSGQRAISSALARHIGIASGFAVEVGLTVEAAHVGAVVAEVPTELAHHVTGWRLSGILHRGRQFAHALKFLLATGYGIRWPGLPRERGVVRLVVWLFSLAALIGLAGLVSPRLAARLAVIVGCALAAFLPSLWIAAVWLRLRKRNYLGRLLPTGAGILLLIIGVPSVLFSSMAPEVRAAGLVVLGALGLAGLLDDLLGGRRQARGLRGHLLSLARGRVTTGAVKAAVGLTAGFAAAGMLNPGEPTAIIVAGLLIALSANFVNLLDLRPGRALKGFAVLCAAAIAAAPDALHFLGPILAAAMVLAPAEFGGRIMLGDVGANLLGGAAGLALATALPWEMQVGAVAALVVIHLVCERVSLTEAIARSRLLSALDRLGSTHVPPFPQKEVTPP